MNTDLKDETGKKLKIGDYIAVCSSNYSLKQWGKAGKEYWFHTGKVYFEKGMVKYSGAMYQHKLYHGWFLIIKRGKKLTVKVDKNWDWNYHSIKLNH